MGKPIPSAAEFVASQRFAWPGGYELFAVTDDGGVLCADCCRTEAERIRDAIPGDGWFVVGSDHIGRAEDAERCDHCDRVMEV